MSRYADSLSTKQIPLFGTRYKNNTIVDSKSQLSPAVHQSRYSQVCQCEQGSPLTNPSAIQMIRRYQHLSHSMFCINFRKPATRLGCKAISSI